MTRQAKRLTHARDRVSRALQLTEDIRRAVVEGEPDTAVLGLVEQLRDVLCGAEDAVGCSTPANLFQ